MYFSATRRTKGFTILFTFLWFLSNMSYHMINSISLYKLYCTSSKSEF
jgi:hypothetical protein